MIEFGEKLKHLREEKGMTQQTLADLLYVTRQAVSRWECGARYPDLMTAKRIAEVLETSIDELVSGEKSERDVEREPILMAPVSNFIQTILYTLGAACCLIMGVSIYYVYFESGVLVFSKDGCKNVLSFTTSIVDVLSYGIGFATMAAGIYYSVKNELSPRKTGIIMSTGFLYTVFSFIGGCIIIMVTGNGEIAPYSYVLLAGNVIAMIIVNRFFWIGRQGKPIWVYVTALALLGQEGWHFKRMMEAVGIDTAEEKGLVFVVLLLGAAGQIATAGLLMYQAYTLDKKRKQVSL